MKNEYINRWAQKSKWWKERFLEILASVSVAINRKYRSYGSTYYVYLAFNSDGIIQRGISTILCKFAACRLL